MKPQWRDVTSYSQKDKEKKSTTWNLKLPCLDITLSRQFGMESFWFLRCKGDIDLQFEVLSSEKIEDAQKEAIKFIKARLTKAMETLESVVFE